MSAVVKALSDLFGSVVEVFSSIIHTIFSMVQSAFSMFGTLVKDVVNLFGGVLEFILGNLFIIGTILALFFAYTVYSQRQAKPIGSKKTS